MARNTILALPANEWAQITDSDVDDIAFQAQGFNGVRVLATADDTPPTSHDGSVLFAAGEGYQGPIMSLFQGVPGAVRVWAMSAAVSGVIWVSHA